MALRSDDHHPPLLAHRVARRPDGGVRRRRVEHADDDGRNGADEEHLVPAQRHDLSALHLSPPGTVAIRSNLPTVYLLDGEFRFQTLVDIVEAMHAQVIIVGIGNEALRARDYVPANSCTMVAQFYAGGHIGMIPLAFAEALAFALA